MCGTRVAGADSPLDSVRGMVDAKSVSEILHFLRVPRNRHADIVEAVAVESVKALRLTSNTLSSSQTQSVPSENLIKPSDVRRQDSSGSGYNTFDTDDPNTRCARKRRRCADDDYGETRLRRWRAVQGEAAKGGIVGSTSGDEFLIIKTRGAGEGWGRGEYGRER